MIISTARYIMGLLQPLETGQEAVKRGTKRKLEI